MIESQFVVLIDQQEGLPYTFPGITTLVKRAWVPMHVRTRTLHLHTGDYSIDGYASHLAIERKTFADFCASFTSGRAREEAKLARLADLRHAWYMLEFSFADLLGGPPPWSECNMKSLRRSLLSYQVRFPGVQWFFAGSREVAEACTYRLLEFWWKQNIERSSAATTLAVASES